MSKHDLPREHEITPLYSDRAFLIMLQYINHVGNMKAFGRLVKAGSREFPTQNRRMEKLINCKSLL